MITLPLWLSFDLILKRNTLHQFYHKAETVLQQKKVALPAILLLLLNWGWSIYKDL